MAYRKGCVTALIIFIFVMIIAAILIVATGWNMPVKQATETAGFLAGIWHGFILPLTFIRSWFDPAVTLYQSLNNGFWYNLGFVLGLGIAFGGGGSSYSSR